MTGVAALAAATGGVVGPPARRGSSATMATAPQATSMMTLARISSATRTRSDFMGVDGIGKCRARRSGPAPVQRLPLDRVDRRRQQGGVTETEVAQRFGVDRG